MDDGIIVLTPLQQLLHIVPRFILQIGPALCSESIHRISFPSSREISSYHAISLFLGAVHQNLRTIIKLWNASRSKQESNALPISPEVSFILAHETGGIMIVQEYQHITQVNKLIILSQYFINFE